MSLKTVVYARASKRSHTGGLLWTPYLRQKPVGSNILLLGVNGGVVHGRGFEYLTFLVSMVVYSAWSWVWIFDFLGVNGIGSNLCLFGVNGGVVPGREFEYGLFGE
jgi:hypothetical protein